MNFFKETIIRIKGETPTYFRKIRAFCLWYAGAAGAYLLSDQMLKLPTKQTILDYIGYSIAIASFMAFGASLPNSTPPQKEVEEKPIADK